VARLTGQTCGGCHLDISRSEADQLGKTAEDERECPNCSRWLVL
jgi:predicted  nucleic acid-binding Zn-ribbon protein